VISLNASLLSVLKVEGREGPVRLPLVTVATKAVPRCPGVITPPTPPPNIQGVFLRRECAKVWASRMLWEAVCSEVYYLKFCLRGSIGEGRMVEFAKVFCSLEAFVT